MRRPTGPGGVQLLSSPKSGIDHARDPNRAGTFTLCGRDASCYIKGALIGRSFFIDSAFACKMCARRAVK